MWKLSCSNIHLDYYLAWHCRFWNYILADSRNAVKPFVSSVKDITSWQNLWTEANSFSQKYFEKCLLGKLQLEIKTAKSSLMEMRILILAWVQEKYAFGKTSLNVPVCLVFRKLVSHTETLTLPWFLHWMLKKQLSPSSQTGAAYTCFHVKNPAMG